MKLSQKSAKNSARVVKISQSLKSSKASSFLRKKLNKML